MAPKSSSRILGGGVSQPSSLIDAIATLETVERQLEEQLAATREALVPLRKLAPGSVQPSAPAPVKRTRRNMPVAGDAALPTTLTAVLKRGPLAPATLEAESGVSRYRLQQFVKRGLLVASGTTNGRRFALPGAPAKEAP